MHITQEFLRANPDIDCCFDSPFRMVTHAIVCENYIDEGEEEDYYDPQQVWWFVHLTYPDEDYKGTTCTCNRKGCELKRRAERRRGPARALPQSCSLRSFARYAARCSLLA